MSQVHGGVKSKSSAKHRRQRALVRAEAQLKSGKKPFPTNPLKAPQNRVVEMVELTDADRRRLEKEIITLKGRV